MFICYVLYYVNNIYVQKKPSKRADKNQTNLATEELSLTWEFRPSRQFLFQNVKWSKKFYAYFGIKWVKIEIKCRNSNGE